MKKPAKISLDRAAEKRASRKRDQKRLDQREVSLKDLNRENSFFAGFDLSKAEIVKWR